MSSFAVSEAVFKDRVAAAGLDESIHKALSDAGFKTPSLLFPPAHQVL